MSQSIENLPDPSLTLKDKRREEVANLHARGQRIVDAWMVTAPTKISKQAGRAGALTLRREPSFLARVEYLKEEIANKFSPNFKTKEGRISAWEHIAEGYFAEEKTTSSADALKAVKELSNIYGDKEAAERERLKVDPSEICAWIMKARMQGLEPGEELVKTQQGLQTLADTIRKAFKLSGVFVETPARYAKTGVITASIHAKVDRGKGESAVKAIDTGCMGMTGFGGVVDKVSNEGAEGGSGHVLEGGGVVVDTPPPQIEGA